MAQSTDVQDPAAAPAAEQDASEHLSEYTTETGDTATASSALSTTSIVTTGPNVSYRPRSESAGTSEIRVAR